MKTFITIIIVSLFQFAQAQSLDDLYFLLNISKLETKEAAMAIKDKFPNASTTRNDEAVLFHIDNRIIIIKDDDTFDNKIVSLCHSDKFAHIQLIETMNESDEFDIVGSEMGEISTIVYESDWSLISLAYSKTDDRYMLVCIWK